LPLRAHSTTETDTDAGNPGQPVYIAPSQVVAVIPVVPVGISVGPNIKVRGSAKQIAEKVSKALGEEMQ
jgi:hypothetical protein